MFWEKGGVCKEQVKEAIAIRKMHMYICVLMTMHIESRKHMHSVIMHCRVEHPTIGVMHKECIDIKKGRTPCTFQAPTASADQGTASK